MNEKFKTTGKEIIKKGDEYIVISKDDKKDFSKISKAIEEISEVLRVSLLAKKDLENQINNSINLLIELTRRFIQEKKED